MSKTSAMTKKILVSLHIIFASVWVGAVAVSLLVAIRILFVTHRAELTALHDILKWIEYVMIIPPAMGSLATGFFLSKWTNWGFFKFRWVTVKWIATVSLILFGAFFLNTWIEGTAGIVNKLGMTSFQDDAYVRYSTFNFVFIPLQWGVLLFMVVISVLKPWGKRKVRENS